ncbi:hypothetical protein H6F88_09195 [Oculatella sp. FACHB-28]|nr:hypothetical protein [Oculatella sp. FACHB-28]
MDQTKYGWCPGGQAKANSLAICPLTGKRASQLKQDKGKTNRGQKLRMQN